MQDGQWIRHYESAGQYQTVGGEQRDQPNVGFHVPRDDHTPKVHQLADRKGEPNQLAT